jgi:hypothetical protein
MDRLRKVISDITYLNWHELNIVSDLVYSMRANLVNTDTSITVEPANQVTGESSILNKQINVYSEPLLRDLSFDEYINGLTTLIESSDTNLSVFLPGKNKVNYELSLKNVISKAGDNCVWSYSNVTDDFYLVSEKATVKYRVPLSTKLGGTMWLLLSNNVDKTDLTKAVIIMTMYC